MEKESNISLGGTIILLALFAQNYTPFYEKGIKQNLNKPMETTKTLQWSSEYWTGTFHLEVEILQEAA